MHFEKNLVGCENVCTLNGKVYTIQFMYLENLSIYGESAFSILAV